MLNNKSFIFLTLSAFLAFGFIIPTEKEGVIKKEKSVKKAVVLYGEKTLFDSFDSLTDEKIQEYYCYKINIKSWGYRKI